MQLPITKRWLEKTWKNDLTIALNVLYVLFNIFPASVSKHNSDCGKHVFLLMFWKKQKKLALSCSKRLLALLREITSNNNGDFYYLNCLRSFRTKNKLESHKKVFENKNICITVVHSEDTKIEFNQHQKSNKAPFIIDIYKYLYSSFTFIYINVYNIVI